MLRKRTAILLLLVSSQIHSQFFEDFENGIPGTMTEVFKEFGISWSNSDCTFTGEDWSGGIPCPMSGDFTASFWNYFQGASIALQTPILDLTNDLYRLEFNHAQ